MLRYRNIMISTLLLLGPLLSKARQDSANSFSAYADQQEKVFVALYEKKDVTTYEHLLQAWQERYRQLPDKTQKQYTRYLANAYYNLACVHALLGNKKPALDYLGLSIQSGYSNYAHMMKDTDLDGIRKDPAFSKMLQPLRATGDYLYILQRAGTYNEKDKRPLPAFTYQPAGDINLTALRRAFNLDSIAGQGHDVSKVLNVLHWVHELIPHDGNHENPAARNALQLIAVCRKDDRGLNCRGLATVLNEAYLALGFASRLVTCLPKDSLRTDPDCHVINMVYVPSLKKWIWADPTNDAYVMNEKGELLGIQEVRERIIRNEPLILNPTANWNHRSSTTKEDYLYRYMAKNLYILQSPAHSTWNMEAPEPGKTIQYIQLLPLDYFKQGPDKKESTSQKSGTTYQYYNTNNPAAFWQLP
ncbi:transglutaminase domain-containing protein [Paraflavitalea soli]|uniref:Transglutaminase domain-containing protein n=1 Tax=Paraflavitalea soli TaxID=2315862 RepID=A0A3B7MQL0_9BACT|nr:transglutaminase-like domain-containing protein [Paraflavitalea soli]AXY73885.1 transglutaminase domain-containing protein [Paraflavitalea soli]